VAREGKGHGEENWETWFGDHRLDGGHGDRGKPVDCIGCFIVEDFSQRGCSDSSSRSGSGVGQRSCAGELVRSELGRRVI
jgi:hypothetical protein